MGTSCASLMDRDDNDLLRTDITNILTRIKDIKELESVIILSASDRAEVRITFGVSPDMTAAQCGVLKERISGLLGSDRRVGSIIFQINPYDN